MSISVVLAVGLTPSPSPPVGLVPRTAWVCAALALFWSVFGAVARRRGVAVRTPSARFLRLIHPLALLLGVAAATVQSVILVMRMIVVGVSVVRCAPWRGIDEYGFGAHGLWSLGFLLCACVVSLLATRDRRLATCLLWSAVLMTSWACLLVPALRMNPSGGYVRTGMTLALPAALSMLIAATAAMSALTRHREITRFTQAGLRKAPEPCPGLSFSVAVIGAAVILLLCYHLAVPISVGPGGFRFTAGVIGGCACVAALASFSLLAGAWSAPLADAAMGLGSLGLCGIATLAVPSRPAALVERYPMLFNAMMIGFAFAAAAWTYLASSRERSVSGEATVPIAHRLVPHAKHFAFLSAALALLLGIMMAVWPQWPGIAASDDSLGRVIAGFSAHLFLLLVALWCSRRLNRLPLQILTVLTVLAAAGFLLVRALPFTSSFS